MPIYEFQCPECESVHEAIVGRDIDSHPCLDCGEESPKIMSVAGFPPFKGKTMKNFPLPNGAGGFQRANVQISDRSEQKSIEKRAGAVQAGGA